MITTHETHITREAATEITSEDRDLQNLLREVNNYLLSFGNNWFFIFLGRSYFKKCVRSWIRVTAHIEKFLKFPRNNYSLLMSVLDIEIQKFPKRSFYGRKLSAISLLLSKGPNFTITSLY